MAMHGLRVSSGNMGARWIADALLCWRADRQARPLEVADLPSPRRSNGTPYVGPTGPRWPAGGAGARSAGGYLADSFSQVVALAPDLRGTADQGAGRSGEAGALRQLVETLNGRSRNPPSAQQTGAADPDGGQAARFERGLLAQSPLRPAALGLCFLPNNTHHTSEEGIMLNRTPGAKSSPLEGHRLIGVQNSSGGGWSGRRSGGSGAPQVLGVFKCIIPSQEGNHRPPSPPRRERGNVSTFTLLWRHVSSLCRASGGVGYPPALTAALGSGDTVRLASAGGASLVRKGESVAGPEERCCNPGPGRLG